MNIKTFTIIAIASFAVLSVTACGGAYSGGYPFSISGDIRSVPS